MSRDLRALLDDATGPASTDAEIARWRRSGRRRRAARRGAFAALPALALCAAVVAIPRLDADHDVRLQVTDPPPPTTDPTTTLLSSAPCGDALPFKSFTTPYGMTAQQPGPATLARAPEVADGQLVAHWTDGGERAIEMRWPSTPRRPEETVTDTFQVAGHVATISEMTPDLRQIVRVQLTDDDHPCSEVSIEGYGTDEAQVNDDLRTFPEQHIVDASAPPPTPTQPVPPRTCAVPPVEPRAEQTVTVYVYCQHTWTDHHAPLVAVQRAVPPTRAALSAALTELLAGTTAAEEAAGLVSGVPEEVEGAPVRVSIDGNGVATIDIDHDVSTVDNFTTSGVTSALFDPVYATAFHFDTVTAVDLGRFCDHTERSRSCDGLTRAAWQRMVTAKRG